MRELISRRVHEYYWNQDLNCAITTLKVLSEVFSVDINNQVIDAATGMNGAGRFGSQCGMVEGALLFIGIMGNQKGFDKEEIVAFCNGFSNRFQRKFKSLLCRELRPQGFNSNNPPHLCEELTKLAITFSTDYISEIFQAT